MEFVREETRESLPNDVIIVPAPADVSALIDALWPRMRSSGGVPATA